MINACKMKEVSKSCLDLSKRLSKNTLSRIEKEISKSGKYGNFCASIPLDFSGCIGKVQAIASIPILKLKGYRCKIHEDNEHEWPDYLFIEWGEERKTNWWNFFISNN